MDNLDAIAASLKSEHTLGYEEMALRIVVNSKDGEAPLTITLVAQTAHEKAAWISDLKQVTNLISFHFISFHFISFHFISFHLYANMALLAYHFVLFLVLLHACANSFQYFIEMKNIQ